MELSINYDYKDLGMQLMILDCGAPVSLAGISWMEQYLQEFNLTIDQMISTACKQPFVFGPSKRYISTSRIDLPILIVRKDGKEVVLTVAPGHMGVGNMGTGHIGTWKYGYQDIWLPGHMGTGTYWYRDI